MTIKYDFDGYEYDYDVPYRGLDKVFKEHYPKIDDWQWWLQFDENEQAFRDEWEHVLHHEFEQDAFEEAKEQAMDPYEFYGVSRSMF